jgi:hypothetical protein
MSGANPTSHPAHSQVVIYAAEDQTALVAVALPVA